MSHFGGVDPRLEGKLAVVTGGSRGIGRAIAAGLHAEGARVLLASRKLESAVAAAEELVGQDDSDISNVRIALAQAAQRVLEERGLPIPEGLDVLMED